MFRNSLYFEIRLLEPSLFLSVPVTNKVHFTKQPRYVTTVPKANPTYSFLYNLIFGNRRFEGIVEPFSDKKITG